MQSLLAVESVFGYGTEPERAASKRSRINPLLEVNKNHRWR